MAALTQTIGGNGMLFVGEDKIFKLELLQIELDSNGTPIAPSASSTPVDMTGWTLLFDVRVKDTSADAILSKTPTVTGTYNASRALNTQRAVVAVSDTEMNLFKQKTYRHSWKRMDDGVETVLSRGNFTPEKATAP